MIPSQHAFLYPNFVRFHDKPKTPLILSPSRVVLGTGCGESLHCVFLLNV